MAAWEMADGTEIRYGGAGVDTRRPSQVRRTFHERAGEFLGRDPLERARTGCCLREAVCPEGGCSAKTARRRVLAIR